MRKVKNYLTIEAKPQGWEVSAYRRNQDGAKYGRLAPYKMDAGDFNALSAAVTDCIAELATKFDPPVA